MRRVAERVLHFRLGKHNALVNHAVGQLIGGGIYEAAHAAEQPRQRRRVAALLAKVAEMPSFEVAGHADLDEMFRRAE